MDPKRAAYAIAIVGTAYIARRLYDNYYRWRRDEYSEWLLSEYRDSKGAGQKLPVVERLAGDIERRLGIMPEEW